MQIEQIKPVSIPGGTKFMLSYGELMDALRKGHPEIPQGGLFELKFDEGTQRLTIIHHT